MIDVTIGQKVLQPSCAGSFLHYLVATSTQLWSAVRQVEKARIGRKLSLSAIMVQVKATHANAVVS